MSTRFRKGLPHKIVVVKFGTKNLSNPAVFADYTRQIEDAWGGGRGTVVVSSGAILHGRNRMTALRVYPHAISPFLGQEELAGIGSRHLLNAWGDAFKEYGKEVGQIWITHANLNDVGERESIRRRILNYLKAGVIPIVNENDVVSNKEIEWMEQEVSENDRLARKIAELVGADWVLFLTDVGGVYEEDPRKNSQARLYEEIASTDVIPGSQTTSSGLLGRGGMKAKIEEAIQCFRAGMRVAIAGNQEDAILNFMTGKPVGTTIGTATRFKQMRE